ncbi:MAG TPA: glycosyltransferase family 4 protein [Solirubrobacteraceae bacterium]|nr:glycosyltransferase family 4 protein [Solirubrobacteraceae bacterium]
MKPVLFVTGHVAADRLGAFERLHERAGGIELALFGGPHLHGSDPLSPPLSLPHRFVGQREIGELTASGGYRAVVVGTGGRVALPLAWRAAQRSDLPFVFWAALWRTPRTAAHLVAQPLMRRIYREATAVVTYGEHVSDYVRRRGATRVFVAPQAVDNAFWSAPAAVREDDRFSLVFAGRAAREKGLAVLVDAWRRAGLNGIFTVAGDDRRIPPDVVAAGRLDRLQLRNLFAVADVVAVPSLVTRRFIEPWGLVVNEAMNQGAAILATDAVGAAAGGLVRDGRNGLIVPAGDPEALADALRSLAADRARCAALGAAGREDVAGFTFDAWAEGFAGALEFAVSHAAAGGMPS